MSKQFIITISLFLLIIIFPNHTQAYTSLSIDPSIVKIQIKPGKAITKAFTITNYSDIEKLLVIRLVPFEKSDLYGNPLIDIKNNSPWQKYITLSNTNIQFEKPFTINPNTKEQIIISISIPESANIEDFYATLLVSTYNNQLSINTKGTSISTSIGANMLVTTTTYADPKTIVKIENIQVSSSSHLKIGRRIYADSLTPLTFTAQASNTGNHLTETKGTVTVTKGTETLSLTGILPQYLISKSSRQLLTATGSQFFTFKSNVLSFGWHQINFNIKSSNTNSTNSIEVFILPFKLIIGLVTTLFLARNIFKIQNKNVDKDI